ncbi:MAG TPA: 23S rRNA (adenine(2503)-C(2))-methyltransferase RlmN [bacterium]|nr:23S rRNA (adenine(2503)-C(2))-methyltransferase RlmN [bacterium]
MTRATADLRGLLLPELADLVRRLEGPAYRARQIARWVYGRGVEDISEMTDLPVAFRARLAEAARIGTLTVRRSTGAADGSATKLLAACGDGQTVECVLMRFDDGRRSACVSTQAGCAMGCAFCATGLGGFARNLTAAEVVGQALAIRARADRRLSNVVFMGMGEPLANYDATVRAARIMTAPWGLGIGVRHLTISTVGLVPQIRRLAAERLQITLAVSLHAPTDALRRRLVPVTERYPIAHLIAACRDYLAATGRRLTFEYVLIDGVNDGDAQARELGRLLRGLLCHVNVIPLNPVPGISLRRPPVERIRAFARVVRDAGIPITVRIERGTEIQAACGQLRLADGSGHASRWTPASMSSSPASPRSAGPPAEVGA